MLWMTGTESETSSSSRKAENVRKGVIIQNIVKTQRKQSCEGRRGVIKRADNCEGDGHQNQESVVHISFHEPTAR